MIWLDHAFFTRRLTDLRRRFESGRRPFPNIYDMLPVKARNMTLFLREWAHGPGTIGAVCASSRQLSVAMAAQVPAGDGLVIELGAGTGMVTQALLDRGISPARLIVIECSSGFVDHLRHRFPGLTITHGDAACLSELIPQGLHIDAIVSSLPLRSLPCELREKIVGQWQQTLDADSALIQFTYDIRPQAHTCACDHAFTVTASQIVWANVPPARVLHAQLIPGGPTPPGAPN